MQDMAKANLPALDHASVQYVPAPGIVPRRFSFPFAGVQYACVSGDIVAIVVASVAGNAVYQYFANVTYGTVEVAIGAGVIAALLYVLIARMSGAYRTVSIFSGRKHLRQVVSQWILVSLILAMLAFLLKIGSSFSRGSIISFALLALVLLLAVRWFSRRIIFEAVANGFVVGRRAVVVGSREELASLDVDNLLRDFGLSEVGRISLAAAKASNLSLSMTEHEASSLERAIEVARDQRADEIALAFPWSDSRKLELLRDRLRDSPLPVTLLPDRRIRSLAKNPAFSLQPSLSIEIQRGPLSGAEQALKRVLDVSAAAVALLLLSPIMLVAAAAIKLDSPGPVLFRQKRKGFNSREFVIFKFRSMTVMEDGEVVRQATKSDARVTRVGRILRQSSIDELPQLLNVLIGDMSLVGPRPHAVAHDTFYGDVLSEYAFRHHVRPGITGWAQVNGYRGETKEIGQMKRRIELDLWYINNWSLLLDLKILAMTCFEVARSRNAF